MNAETIALQNTAAIIGVAVFIAFAVVLFVTDYRFRHDKPKPKRRKPHARYVGRR